MNELNALIRTICPCGKLVTVQTYAGNFCDECAKAIPLVCDFCVTLPIVWRYPTKTFLAHIIEIGTTPLIEINKPPQRHIATSVEDWGACDMCWALIEHGQWDALAERNIQLKGGDPSQGAGHAAKHMLLLLFENFAKNRIGAAYKVGTL